VKGPIADLERMAWKGRKVVIAYDADSNQKDLVRFARAELARHLRGCGAVVGFLEWDATQGKGIDDHLALVGPEKVLDQLLHVRFTGLRWQDELLRSKVSSDKNESAILPILANAITALRLAPQWQGVLAYDEFRNNVVALKSTPWGGVPNGGWTDQEDRLTAEWLQHNRIFVSVEIASQAVQTVAAERRVHPIRQYLDSEMGRHATAESVAIDVSWRGREQLRICSRVPLDALCRGANLSPRYQSRLLLDSGGSTRHQEIDGAAHARWRILHR
jgi:hypothetical protein